MSSLTIVTAYDTTAEVDVESRTIEGLAVPYGVIGNPGGSIGRPVEFAPGAFSRSLSARSEKVRLIVDHDRTRPIGRLLSYSDNTDGLRTTWRIASTAAGDQIIAEASDGVRDGLSVGAEILNYEQTPGRVIVTEARLIEVSLVAFPAFDAARVSRVAAESVAGRDPRVLRLLLTLENS